jgi:hypothetical protein
MVLNASNFLRTDVVIKGILVIGGVAYASTSRCYAERLSCREGQGPILHDPVRRALGPRPLDLLSKIVPASATLASSRRARSRLRSWPAPSPSSPRRSATLPSVCRARSVRGSSTFVLK